MLEARSTNEPGKAESAHGGDKKSGSVEPPCKLREWDGIDKACWLAATSSISASAGAGLAFLALALAAAFFFAAALFSSVSAVNESMAAACFGFNNQYN